MKAIDNIVTKGVFETNLARAKAIIHCGVDLEINQLISIDNDRDYANNLGDVVKLEAYVPLGNFIKLILPKRETLQVTLMEQRGIQKNTNRYKAILLNIGPDIENNMYEDAHMEDLNVEMAYIRLQLVDVHLDKYRGILKDGIVEKQNLDNLMTCIMAPEWYRIITPGDIYNKTFSMIPPHNPTSFSHIMIPSDLAIMDLPAYLQGNDYGIYKGGVGTYIQCHEMPQGVPKGLRYCNSNSYFMFKKFRTLWIYPLFNSRKEDRINRKMKIFVSTERKFKEIERTYGVDSGNSIQIVATTDDEISIPKLSTMRNVGNTDVRYDPKSMISRSHEYTDSLVKIDTGVYNNRDSLSPSPDGEGVNIIHGKKANDYNFKTESMIMRGKTVLVEWRFSVPDLLTPGMLMDFYYNKNGGYLKLSGVLQRVYTVLDNTREMSISKLFIFITKYEDY